MKNVLNNCNCSLFHFATFVARFHQSFDWKITATEHFCSFFIFFFLNFKHFTQKLKMFYKKALKSYILTDFSSFIK